MVRILGRVPTEDLEKFVGVFSTRGAEMRGKHGDFEEDGRMVVLFGWESREAFGRSSKDPKTKETVKSGGPTVPPEFTFLEKVGEFPA